MGHSLGQGLARLAPAAVTIVALLTDFSPTGALGPAAPAPYFGVMAVYYWSLYYPRLMPRWFAFMAGLLHDALSSAPLGLMALTLLIVREFCNSQRQLLLSASFLQIWFGYGLAAAMASGLGWVIFGVFQGDFAMKLSDWVAFGVSVALFPLVAWLFNRAERAMPRLV
jgi:rod shape-determining protein MreD